MLRALISLVFLVLSSGIPQQQPAGLAEADAMKMLYQSYDDKLKAYVWASPQIPDGLCYFDFYSGQPLFVTAYKSWQVQEGGNSKVYLVTSAQPDDPSWGKHPDAPLVGVAVFTRDGSNWRIELQNSALGCFGTLGSPAGISLVQWADNIHALRIDSSSTNQGETSGDILLLAPVSGSFKKILELRQSYYDDCVAGVVECLHTETTLQFVQKSGSDYYDLQVTTTDKNAAGTTSKTQLYRFDGQKYVEPGESS